MGLQDEQKKQQLLNRAEGAGLPVARLLASYGGNAGPESISTTRATPLATPATPIFNEPVGGMQNAGLAERVRKARRMARIEAQQATPMQTPGQVQDAAASDAVAPPAGESKALMDKAQQAESSNQMSPEKMSGQGPDENMRKKYAKRIKAATLGGGDAQL